MLNPPLSSKAEYAIIAMFELATCYSEPSPIPLRVIAQRHEDLKSEQFLVQVLLQLKLKGLVISTRGAAGGYQLAREPEKISLWEILEAIDSSTSTAANTEPEELPSPNLYLQVAEAAWKEANAVRKESLQKVNLRQLIEKIGGKAGIPNYQI